MANKNQRWNDSSFSSIVVRIFDFGVKMFFNSVFVSHPEGLSCCTLHLGCVSASSITMMAEGEMQIEVFKSTLKTL